MHTTEPSDDIDNTSDAATSGRELAIVALSLLVMAVIVGTILATSGVALPLLDPGGMNPLADDDDDNIVAGQSMPEENTTNESSSDDDDTADALLPGADENRADDNSSETDETADSNDSSSGADGTDEEQTDPLRNESDSSENTDADRESPDLLPGADDNRSENGGEDETGDDEDDTDKHERESDRPSTLPGTDDGSGDEDSEELDSDDVTMSVDGPTTVESDENATFTVEMTADMHPNATDTTGFLGEARLIDDWINIVVDSTEYSGYEQTSFELTYPGTEVENETTIPIVIETHHGTESLDLVIEPGDGDGEWTDEEREEAAEMIQQYYEGYLAGISMATDSGWAHEQAAIRNDTGYNPRDPWPLEEWNSTDEAFEDGWQLADREGIGPIADDYKQRNPYRGNDSARSDGDDG